MRIKVLITIIASQFLAAQIFANIPYHDRGVALDFNLVSSSCSGTGIDFSRIAQIFPDSISSDDVSRMIPTDIPATANGGQVASHIADRSMQSYFNSESFKATNLGKTSHSVEKSIQQDVTIGGSAPNSIQHNFKFNMQAAQTTARIDYTGYANANLSYKASAQELNLEVYHNLAANMKLAYNHINSPSDQRDVVSLRLGF